MTTALGAFQYDSRSVPEPPSTVSLPAPGMTGSSPPNRQKTSLLALPCTVSTASLPTNVHVGPVIVVVAVAVLSDGVASASPSLAVTVAEPAVVAPTRAVIVSDPLASSVAVQVVPE